MWCDGDDDDDGDGDDDDVCMSRLQPAEPILALSDESSDITGNNHFHFGICVMEDQLTAVALEIHTQVPRSSDFALGLRFWVFSGSGTGLCGRMQI